MKKLILSIAALMAAVLPSDAQLLYKISGNGLKKDSYIMGTFHLADGTFIDKVPGAVEAINNTDQVCGELVMSVTSNPDSVALLTQKQLLPDGKTIKDVLTPEQFAKLDKYAEKVLGAPLSNPMLFAQIGKMSPAALTNTFTLLSYMKRDKHQVNPQNAVDADFQTRALAAGKGVMGFETVSYQANVLFGTPIERQIVQMMCLVNDPEYYDMMTDKLVEAYYTHDLDRVNEVMNMKVEGECDDTPEERDALLTNRNNNWVKVMPSIMSQKPTLFVVGAGHLLGERGVITQLRNAGYKVEGTYKKEDIK